jgi:hypothetical protein
MSAPAGRPGGRENEVWLRERLFDAVDSDLAVITIVASNGRNFSAMGNEAGLEYCIRLIGAHLTNGVAVLAKLKAMEKGRANG